MPDQTVEQVSIVVKTVGDERNLAPPVRRIDASATKDSSEHIPPTADNERQEHRPSTR